MKFWLDRGTDGFRMDVIDLISKAPGFPDAPVVLPHERWQPAERVVSNGPRLHEFLKEMRREVLSTYDVMTVGEMPWMTDKHEALKVIGEDRGELDMIFQFDMYVQDSCQQLVALTAIGLRWTSATTDATHGPPSRGHCQPSRAHWKGGRCL